MKNEEKQNTIERSLTTLSDDVFKENKVIRKTTLDLSNEKEQDLYLATMYEVDEKLNDHAGEEITFNNVIISEFPTNVTNEDTGEVITKYKHTLCLFDEKGKSYVTGSASCFQSFMMIASIKGMPTKEHPLKLKVVKVPKKDEPEHSFLRLQLVK